MSAELRAALTPPTGGLIYQIIPKVMADIGAVGKDQKNEQQGYKFRGIEDVNNASHPAFVKNGLFCTPQLQKYDSQDRMNPTNGKLSIRVVVEMKYIFYTTDGSSVDVIMAGEAIDSSDKATNKAMSAAFKYALVQLFNIPTKEDADFDSPDAGARKIQAPRSTEPVTFKRTVKEGVNYKESEPISSLHQQDSDVLADVIDRLVTAGLPPKAAEPEQPALHIPAYITGAQCRKLHADFRGTVPPEFSLTADNYFYGWLLERGYANARGEPGAEYIPADHRVDVAKGLLAYARSLKPGMVPYTKGPA